MSRSYTEAGYKALTNATTHVEWIRLILKDLQVLLPHPPVLHCDNIFILPLCSNLVFHTRIKHLDTSFLFVCEWVQKGDLQVEYLAITDQVADMLTKGLHSPSFLQPLSQSQTWVSN